jgi:hypothetical protein
MFLELKEHIVTNLMHDQTHSSQSATNPQHHQHQDSLSRVTWASIFVLAGLISLANNFGYLPAVQDATTWSWIMLGAGALLLLENAIRVFSVDHHGPHLWSIIGGCVLFSMGLGTIFGINILKNPFPIILIVGGLLVISRGLRRR